MSIIFEAKVTKIGDLVPDFMQEQMVILFDDTSPKELHDVAILHSDRKNNGEIRIGDSLLIDGEHFEIGYVGNVVNKTIQDIGHVTLKFNGEKNDLPGTICVEYKPIPIINPGTVIQIIRGS